MDKIITLALTQESETYNVEFKSEFDTSSNKDWCEIIKDIVAIANSGGGVIVFGLDNHGKPSGRDISNLENLDPAHITDKIKKYTELSFADFKIIKTEKENKLVYALEISRCNIPMIFTRPGTYATSQNKQNTAFGVGTIYFRHGAKSEPGNSNDIRKSIQLEVESIRDSWLSTIRKVVEAPVGSKLRLLPPNEIDQGEYTPLPIQVVTDDLNAPKYVKIDPDISHPYRFTDVIRKINKRIKDYEINQYHLNSINKVYSIKNNDVFCHNPKFGTAQYSTAYINWIFEQYEKDREFFNKTNQKYYEIRCGN